VARRRRIFALNNSNNKSLRFFIFFNIASSCGLNAPQSSSISDDEIFLELLQQHTHSDAFTLFPLIAAMSPSFASSNLRLLYRKHECLVVSALGDVKRNSKRSSYGFLFTAIAHSLRSGLLW
jgi:hypothetical protein